MKSSSILLLLVMAGVGYVLYPMVLPVLEDSGLVAPIEKEATDKGEEGEKVAADVVPVVDVDLTGVTPEDFPDEVELRVPVKLTLSDKNVLRLEKGTKVEPVRLEGDDLIFKPMSVTHNARIPLDDTNFKELIKPILEDKRRKEAEERKRLAEEAAKVNEEPDPAPEPQPEPEPEPKMKQLSEGEVVDLMKSSIAAGAVREFQAERVLAWKLDGSDTVGGKEYQVGLIIYNAETIFGEQKHEAKALISDGKIEKWIWAKTGVEIR